jgi:hypothetical protein
LSLVHAGWLARRADLRVTSPAWREQCWLIAALALGAMFANWATTGDHLVETITRGYWPVAGVDLALLSASVCAIAVARRLSRRVPQAGLAEGGLHDGVVAEGERA